MRLLGRLRLERGEELLKLVVVELMRLTSVERNVGLLLTDCCRVDGQDVLKQSAVTVDLIDKSQEMVLHIAQGAS